MKIIRSGQILFVICALTLNVQAQKSRPQLSLLRCTALAMSASKQSAELPPQVRQLGESARSWFAATQIQYDDTFQRELAPHLSQMLPNLPPNAAALATQCNQAPVSSLLTFAPVENGFPADRRFHAEACMSILSTAAGLATDEKGRALYKKIQSRAHGVVTILSAEGIGEEGGTQVFRWISERNRGSVNDVSVSDINYCGIYYRAGVRVSIM